MPMHPVAQELIDDFIVSGRPNAHLLPVPVARENFEALFGGIEGPDVAVVTDVVIPVAGADIRGRVYRPDESDQSAPLMVFFHGGGWLLGSIDSHDMMARKIANATGCVVVSVDYRRGPESRFPTAVDDAVTSVAWAVDHASQWGADASLLTVAGDSAGGNLAAVVAQRARDAGAPHIEHQLLIYPVTTCDLIVGFDMQYEGALLYRDEMQWHQDNYLASESDAVDPGVSPLLGDLAGLPSATVVLAECDPIRPQGQLYADALVANGVEVRAQEFPGMIHGFFGLETLFPEAADAMDFAGDSVRRALGTSR